MTSTRAGPIPVTSPPPTPDHRPDANGSEPRPDASDPDARRDTPVASLDLDLSPSFVFERTLAVLDRTSTLPPTLTVMGATVAIGFIGIADWWTGDQLSFVLFYLVALALVGWTSSPRTATAVSVFAAGISLLAALTTPDSTTSSTVIVVNTVFRLVFFLAFSWGAGTMRRSLDELQRQATRDPLTKLLNRRAFYAEVDRERTRALRNETTLTMVYLDLDGLKVANDTLGHDVGDAMLVRFVRILRSVARETDPTARLGGDEFAVLLTPGGEAAARTFLERLTDVLAHDDPPISVSAGAVIFTVPPDSVERMVQQADALMYEAKHHRRGSHRVRTVA